MRLDFFKGEKYERRNDGSDKINIYIDGNFIPSLADLLEKRRELMERKAEMEENHDN